MRLSKKIAAICTALLLTLFGCSVFAVQKDAELYDQMIRLHVLANSDSEADQALKLQVRDRLLSEVSALTACASSLDDAVQILCQHAPRLQALAKSYVQDAGYDYPVTIRFSPEHYEVRQYQDFTLPAGEYLSLRVEIGKAEGQNWWCVLFPPLCTGAAEAREEMVEAGFTQNQIRILTESDNPKYVLRFKAVEWYAAMREEILR